MRFSILSQINQIAHNIFKRNSSFNTWLILAVIFLNFAESAESATQKGFRAASISNIHHAKELKLRSGIASWYGNPFHGRRTASGQIYDMNKLTGAHLTLPLSSKVIVKNPHNGKVVIITVTDRGPYVKDRVIDLSHEAAKQLGILSCGIALVNYAVIQPESSESELIPDKSAGR